jgi:hypothetical protein
MVERKGWRVLEWLGRLETIHVLITSDFVRTLLLPTAATAAGAVSGWLQGIPIMWVLVGSSLIFMAVTQSLLRASEYRERRNPQNKLQHSVIFQFDLNPAEVPYIGNRKQRRTQQAIGQAARTLGANEINPYVNRILTFGQLGVELTNTGSFPISCYLENAKSDIEGIEPPRSDFPKPAATIPAGSKVRVCDDRIELDDMPCHRLTGNIDLQIKYGLPGKERFEVRIKGPVAVQMETWGLVSSVALSLS